MIALLLQSADQLPQYGVSAGIAGLVLYFWRQDRKDRAEEKAADVQRLENLTKDFRAIVTDNTAAMTRLADLIQSRCVSACAPLPHEMQRPKAVFPAL